MYNTFINESLEEIVHHHLKGCWAICKAKEHDQGFEEATISLECCLPFISFLYVNIVIAPTDVQLGEVLSFGVKY